MTRKKQATQVYTVTTLPVDVKKDYNRRVKTYSIIMLIRMVCIALIFIIPLPWGLIPILFAVLSPWFAVIIANDKHAGTSQTIEKPALYLE